ncbi:MAG: archaeosortase/exosortase family protein [Verrucomicrobiales bacterium]
MPQQRGAAALAPAAPLRAENCRWRRTAAAPSLRRRFGCTLAPDRPVVCRPDARRSDEPLGIFALLLAAWFGWRQRRAVKPGAAGVAAAIGAVVCLALAAPPPPLRCMRRHGSACFRWRSVSGAPRGVAALMFLSLPLVASLHPTSATRCAPLRRRAAALLRLTRIGVSASGAVLDWRGTSVAVDAPCSGVRMLWSASPSPPPSPLARDSASPKRCS